MMTIDVYSGGESPNKIGEVKIMYDRIVHIKLKVKINYNPVEKRALEALVKQTGKPLQTHKEYDVGIQSKFAIKPLSKADLGYRSAAKLTHELLSKDVSLYTDVSFMFVKLSTWQIIKINYNLRKYVWQTSDFRKHIYYHIATAVLGGILGIVGTLIIAPWKQDKILLDTTPQKQSNKAPASKNPNNNDKSYGGADSNSQRPKVRVK